MLIAEDLLLLLTDDDTGKLEVTGSQVDIALGGSQLVELSLTGHVDIDERRRLVVRDTTPPQDEILARALETIREREGKKPSAVINRLAKHVRAELYERLATSGFVRAEEGRVLGLFPTTRWPASSVDHEAAVRRAITSALVDGATPEPRDGSLVALLHALRATHKVVDPREHDLSRKDLERRAKQIAEGSWGSTAVRQAIDEMTAAVMVAVTAGAAATSAGAS